MLADLRFPDNRQLENLIEFVDGLTQVDPEIDERDTLSEAHASYMQKYIAFELERQERVSDRFLKERSCRHDLLSQQDSQEVESMPLPIKDVPGAS